MKTANITLISFKQTCHALLFPERAYFLYPPHLSLTLPEEPVLKIRPKKYWAAIGLGEIWAHREIFSLPIWRDLKLRYKQTLLGTGWVILQPLLMTLVFTIFFRLIGHPPVKNVPYPLFLYAGLLPWMFFSTAVLSSSYSLISQADMVRKIYFPRVLLPAAAVAVRRSDFIISLAALIFLMVGYGVFPTASITVFFISHNLSMIQELCPRALLIESGVLYEDGEAASVIAKYLRGVSQPGSQENRQLSPLKNYRQSERSDPNVDQSQQHLTEVPETNPKIAHH